MRTTDLYRRLTNTVVLDTTTGFRHVECERCQRIVAVFDQDLDHHWTEPGLTPGDVQLLDDTTHICAHHRIGLSGEERPTGCEHARMSSAEIYPGFTRCSCQDCGLRWLTHSPRAIQGRWMRTDFADLSADDGRRPHGLRDASECHASPSTTAE